MHDARSSDPTTLGWMNAYPPPVEKRILVSDASAYRFPQIRWSFSHYQELYPTRPIDRGIGPVRHIDLDLRDDLDAISFTPTGSHEPMRWEQSLEKNFTDGIVVLHRGKCIYERYFGALRDRGHHLCASVTKSFVGTLAAWLIDEGRLDPKAPVIEWVPELAHSGFAHASVDQVLHMTTAIRYDETYANPEADIWKHLKAGGVFPRSANDQGPGSFTDYLQTVVQSGIHGEQFAYRTPNTDVLSWILKRVANQSLSDMISERIWQPMGAERDAAMQIDTLGFEFAGGGLLAVLRDLARFGEIMRMDGKQANQQIIPKSVVHAICKGGDQAKFKPAGYTSLPGWSYGYMWWHAHDDHEVFTARGVHGQTIYIDPKAEMVIARFASHPIAANVQIDPHSLPAYRALAKHLLREGS